MKTFNLFMSLLTVLSGVMAASLAFARPVDRVIIDQPPQLQSTKPAVVDRNSKKPAITKLSENLPDQTLSEALNKPVDPVLLESIKIEQPTPFQKPFTRIFGFETSETLDRGAIIFEFGGASFNNRQDITTVTTGTSNRSNDAHLDLRYGITDKFQFNIGLAGKDDTIFSNIVRNPSGIQFINNVIPVQAKWKFLDRDRIQSSALIGVEFADPLAALFFRPGRTVRYSEPTTTPGSVKALRAQDDNVYLGLALPISYQASDNFKLHLNPQVSFFPKSLTAQTTNSNTIFGLSNNEAIFNGTTQINYYGTVAGIGIGAEYQVSPNLKLAADVTAILAGQNSVGSGSSTNFLTRRAVWNAGLQYTPNSQSAFNLYASNKFSSTQSTPSNLLVQPGGDWAIGFDIGYSPNLNGNYRQERRSSYPKPSAFLSTNNGFSSTTLPIGAISYEVGFAKNTVSPAIRISVLDDLELAIYHSSSSRREMAIETGLTGRWALVADRGQEGISTTIDLSLLRIDGKDLELGYSLGLDLPIAYNIPKSGLRLTATPKLFIPAQFQQVQPTVGLSLGAAFDITPQTQLLGQFTPILTGENQLVAGKSFAFQGKSLGYSIGLRQLFPTANSVYSAELYYTNTAGTYGFQGAAVLPNGERQIGVKLGLLNGL